MDADPRVHVETIEEWVRWLEANHARASGVWMVTWRTATARPAPTYEEAVTEALRFGWVDSVQRRLDDERTMLRYSPRRPGGGWSKSNKDRIARLQQEGRMAPAGQQVVDEAIADGTWSLLDAVEALEVPDDLAAAFAAHPGAREHWEAFPRSAKRAILEWIVRARRPETRQRRVLETAERAARGEPAHR